jgi:hypothetical protein
LTSVVKLVSFFENRSVFQSIWLMLLERLGPVGEGAHEVFSYRGKGKTPVGAHEKSKKLGVWVRAQLRYLEKEHEKFVARGEAPPFDLEDLLRRYAPLPRNPEVPALPSSSAPAKNPLEHSAFPPKNG